ncbi:MAG: transcriptional repressor [Clostridia bacterium]|nr:transcriptional repressor [Clostridia bacterium]
MNDQLKQIYQTMKEKGFKLTPARKSMLKIFLESEQKLLNAKQIFNLVKKKSKKTNFSTVYRNLEVLTENGIVEKISYNKETKYKLRGQGSHHHFMVCTLCYKTIPLPFCPFGELETYIKSDTDFLPINHHVEIYGYCNNCRQKLEN